ncbi:MAG: GNAT family N-acetyltransferase [Caldilineaceae bacterium]
MQLAYLADHPLHLPTLAVWHYAQWGHLNAGETLQGRIERLRQHVGKPAIPTTVIALEGELLLGSASVVGNDLRTHPHLSPFLASVYVAPEFRRRGIASALVREIMHLAHQLAFPTLYLITPDQQRLYASLGWAAQEEVEYRGEWVTVMTADLAKV